MYFQLYKEFLDPMYTIRKITNNIIPTDVNTLDVIFYKTFLANAAGKWSPPFETHLPCATITHYVLKDEHNCVSFFVSATWKQIVLVINRQK